MFQKLLRIIFTAVLVVVSQLPLVQTPAFSQVASQGSESRIALDRALNASSLTFLGQPFHAVLDIGSPGQPYSGRVEVWWVDAVKYHLTVKSPGFSQTKTVNGNEVEEKDVGDYYPRWLENFVLALINPVPMARNFEKDVDIMGGGGPSETCLKRDDRPGGITDQMTWGLVCFARSEPHVTRLNTFNESLEFADWRAFGQKQIARTYTTDVLGFKPVVGQLTKLEDLKEPDQTMFLIKSPTPEDQRITTEFVSTGRAESLLEKAPVIKWPPVREGRTDGYMIVYARTDRTGQVRETAKHNSDQPGLESFGIEQALLFKFKPLVVDGLAQQMEMPLVLHFSSRLADVLPILTPEQMRKQMSSCDLGKLPRGTPRGTVLRLRISVNEQGKWTGNQVVGTNMQDDWGEVTKRVRSCRFAPYIVNGKATYYKGDVEFVAP